MSVVAHELQEYARAAAAAAAASMVLSEGRQAGHNGSKVLGAGSKEGQKKHLVRME